MISRELGAFIRSHYEYFNSWEHIVVYYDNGQKELTNIVNSVFNAYLTTVEVRKAAPTSYNLLQVADLCCTLALLRTKIQTPGMGLSKSESDFFATSKDSAERALKKGYFRMIDRKRFSSQAT